MSASASTGEGSLGRARALALGIAPDVALLIAEREGFLQPNDKDGVRREVRPERQACKQLGCALRHASCQLTEATKTTLR